MYSGLGLSSLASVAHGIVLFGWEEQRMRMGLDWQALTVGCTGLGALFYVTRVSSAVLSFPPSC